MKIFRVSIAKIGKSALFMAEDVLKAKQQFLEHFQVPWTPDNWLEVIKTVDVEERPVNEHGFIDLTEDFGPDGTFTENNFRPEMDE